MGSSIDTFFFWHCKKAIKNLVHGNSIGNESKLIGFGIEISVVNENFGLSASYSFTDVGHAPPVRSYKGREVTENLTYLSKTMRVTNQTFRR